MYYPSNFDLGCWDLWDLSTSTRHPDKEVSCPHCYSLILLVPESLIFWVPRHLASGFRSRVWSARFIPTVFRFGT